MLDVKIMNGLIADGTGAPLYRADIGIDRGMIAGIGDLSDAESRETVDALDKIVCPGFIDMHTHSDVNMLLDPMAESALCCGVTTHVTGNCGIGAAPLSYSDRQMILRFTLTNFVGTTGFPFPDDFDFPWTLFSEYQEYIRRHPPVINMASLVAHGPVRMSVMGMDPRPAGAGEIRQMRRLIEDGMESGAFGLSTGLAYSPGDFVSSDELAETSRILRRYGGIFTSHIRDQSDGIFEALEEVRLVTEKAGVPLHVSHLKLASPKMWGRTEEVFRWFENVNRSGQPVTFDVYPYTVGASTMLRVMPPWVKEGGIRKTVERMKNASDRRRILFDLEHGLPGWDNLASVIGVENIILTSFSLEKNRGFAGLSLAEIAKITGKDPWEAYFDIAEEEKCGVNILAASMSRQDMEAIVKYPGSIIISDGQAQSYDEAHPYGMEHPRVYGTQPKILGEFVRDRGILTMEDAVKKMTSLPARVLGMKKRGILKPGNIADVTVFDPATVADRSGFLHPRIRPEGIETVLLEGKIVLKDGEVLCRNAGQLIEKE